MTVRRRRVWVAVLTVVLLATGLGVALAVGGPSPIHVRETQGVTYVVYRQATLNDAVGHRGTLGVDSGGCVYFDLGAPEPAVRYRAAFPEGTEVSAKGVGTTGGRFYAFGDEVVVGREHDPYFDSLDEGALAKCDARYDLFGMGFF